MLALMVSSNLKAAPCEVMLAEHKVMVSKWWGSGSCGLVGLVVVVES